MRFPLLLLACLATIVVITIFRKKRANKNSKQKPTPTYPSISQRDFCILAKQAAKKIKRIIELKVEGTQITGKVLSQSGISDWKFVLDFGDISKLTGKWSSFSENEDSEIPQIVGKAIRDAIENYPSVTIEDANYYAFCPMCGKRLSGKRGAFCTHCGERF